MEEKIITVREIKTAVRIEGEGDPFLILHGWGAGKSSWEKIEKILSNHFKVVTFDFPGFGLSGQIPSAWSVDNFADFALAVADAVKIKKFYLLGHSFGGRIAIKMASQNGQRIKKLILVDSAGIKSKKKIKNWILSILTKVSKKFEWLPGHLFFKKIFYRLLIKNTDYLEADGTKKESYLMVIKEDLTSLLEKINLKTLIVWGRFDKITPLKDAYLIKEKIKNSKLVIIDCGHRPHQEMPDSLARTIIEFIKNEPD